MDMRLGHPLYKTIVDLGPDAVPLMLNDDPCTWSDALEQITGVNPVPSDAHTPRAVAAAWRKWAKENNL
jgi:hypothetical protein